MQPIADEQRQRQRQQAEHLAKRQGVIAEDLQHIGQQGDARAEQDKPDDIERLGVFFAIIGKMQINQDQAGDPDRQIGEKDESPVEISDDQAADDGPEHGADQSGYGDEAHGADEFGSGESSHQGEAAHRDHHGAAAALQHATGDKEMNVA